MENKVVELTPYEILNLKYVIEQQQVEMIKLAKNATTYTRQKEIMKVYHELEGTYQKLDSLSLV